MQESGKAVMRAAGGGLALGLAMAVILGGSSDAGMAELGYLIQVMVLLTALPVFFAGFILWLTGRTAAQQLPPAV
jgi:ACR3 family arsenite efflux pump ArsB